jgi:3-keto-disaccharide hydrolase
MKKWNLRNCAQGNRVIHDNFAGLRRSLLCLALLAAFVPASAQSVNLFPADYQAQWTRVAIPPDHPVSNVAQWHIDAAKHTIACDGNGGHEWLRFNRELGNFTFHVKWRFTPVTTGTPKYNSGVFFRNNEDGSIWHQAQTSLNGGYIFGVTPVGGKPQRFNLQKEMKENRVKPAGEWNTYDIRCMDETCTLAVNGEVVNTLKTGVNKGYIGLEAEGYQITFKDFKVRLLP